MANYGQNRFFSTTVFNQGFRKSICFLRTCGVSVAISTLFFLEQASKSFQPLTLPDKLAVGTQELQGFLELNVDT